MSQPTHGENPASLAREAISNLLRGRTARKAEEGLGRALSHLGEKPLDGLFLTLRDPDGEVRGSAGTMKPNETGGLLSTLALAAAQNDPRFPPLLDEAKLRLLSLEAWILFDRRALESFEEIREGEALLVVQGLFSGVFLPDLYMGKDWDPLSYLKQACKRAGLDAEAYLEPMTHIWALQAIRFDDQPNAPS